MSDQSHVIDGSYDELNYLSYLQAHNWLDLHCLAQDKLAKE